MSSSQHIGHRTMSLASSSFLIGQQRRGWQRCCAGKRVRKNTDASTIETYAGTATAGSAHGENVKEPMFDDAETLLKIKLARVQKSLSLLVLIYLHMQM
jgi:hypothetical protein